MTRINLRDYYPFYKHDFFIEHLSAVSRGDDAFISAVTDS
jgi:hypothetical protein